jgi:deoxyribodipyrimidine photo-lyase
VATYHRALTWIRRDLRLSDNASLAETTSLAKEVGVVFVFDTNILDVLPDRDDRRVTFIFDSLMELDRKLRHKGSQLFVLHGDPATLIPSLANSLDVDAVFTARDYEPYALERDRRVGEALRAAGRAFHLVKDQVIFEGDEIQSGGDHPFRVFSPFMRAWKSRFEASRDAHEHQADLPRSITRRSGEFDMPDLADLGFSRLEPWLAPGEDAASERLKQFEDRLSDYAQNRDYPAIDGTSGLSVHLRFGTISIRRAVRSALSNDSVGAQKWLNELIWREFYQSILANFPAVVHTPFQEQYGKIDYPGKNEHFEAWCLGRTGFPIVDAAMRCLNDTGWMHNRLRMVTASFLTKDLLVDYRKGEAYFARKLLDFDLASNNGGWQWAASTGADPQPYFRVFNPVLQSKKFDPDGVFIKRYLPELAGFDCDLVHWPHQASQFDQASAGCYLGRDYPHPIVDHAAQRERAITLLKSAR